MSADDAVDGSSTGTASVMMASAKNPLRRIGFIGPPGFSHQHDGCQAQGKGGGGGASIG